MLAFAQDTWLNVVGALVPSLIALVAAIVSLLNRATLRTANGKTIGQMVEETHAQTEATAASVEATK